MAKKFDDDADFVHPTLATATSRHAVDALLRDKYGFRLKSRPRKGQAIWTRSGNDYTQEEAEDLIPESELKKARREERLYIQQEYQ